jgi:hypothetical protein
MLSLDTARKHVKMNEFMGFKPIHYGITFYQKLNDDLILCFDYWHEKSILNYYIQLGEN